MLPGFDTTLSKKKLNATASTDVRHRVREFAISKGKNKQYKKCFLEFFFPIQQHGITCLQTAQAAKTH
jgi:hypothetical protein